MKILIDLSHPAHVHFFKYFIWQMEERGHEIIVTARDKDITKTLLEVYNIPHLMIGRPTRGRMSLATEWIKRGYELSKIGRRSQADIYLGILNPAAAISARLNRKYSLTFTDTEHASFAKKVTFPFTNEIITPQCYRDTIGPKQVRYNGYHELAYLHPAYFSPNPSVLTELDLTKDDPFIIIRFVSWQASHDIGQHGFEDKVAIVRELEKYGRVLITSEVGLTRELQNHSIYISPEKLHDLLSYATLYIGEGGTMATEAAVLGTPSIYVSSLAGTMGNFIELEKTYRLVYSFTGGNAGLKKAVEILQDPAIKKDWKTKREQLLREKIDVTAFMIWFIENYPASPEEMKKV